MITADLQHLIENCDDSQREVIAGVVLRIVSIKSDQWTGQLALELNAVCGKIADMHVRMGERVRFGVKEKM